VDLQVDAAAAAIRAAGVPDVAVVLGSGWAAVADALGAATWAAPMADLPGFAAPTALGHGGSLRLVSRGAHRVLVYLGRLHLYEGHTAATVTHPVRVAVAAGCRVVVLTNAAGGIDPAVPVGTPTLLRDHVNLTARSTGTHRTPGRAGPQPAERPGRPYSDRLRAIARQVDPSLPEGVYAGLPGPHFETPAEVRMLHAMGADLVGMSTVLEAAAACAAGAEVLAVSLVSNHAAGVSAHPLSAQEVLDTGRAALPRLTSLLAGLLDRLPGPGGPPVQGAAGGARVENAP
jgi:purine-nucleoside phosphorylase